MEEDYKRMSNNFGSKCYADEIIRDLAIEPVVICEVEKRRKCDSYYIKLYNELEKKYVKLLSEYMQTKELLQLYQEILNDIMVQLKGGEHDE